MRTLALLSMCASALQATGAQQHAQADSLQALHLRVLRTTCG